MNGEDPIGKNADIDVKDAANELAELMGADIVQVIGRPRRSTRQSGSQEKKGAMAPWRK